MPQETWFGGKKKKTRYTPSLSGRHAIFPYGPGMPPPPLPGMEDSPRVSRSAIITWGAVLLLPILILLSVFVTFVFLGRPYIVNGMSMFPTLDNGDRVLVVPYRGNTTPDRGDVVVLKEVAGSPEMLIKRVVALSGDRVEMSGDNLVVNGTFIYRNTARSINFDTSQLVPDGHVFVMGDNEARSFDSRSFGAIPEEKIVGKAILIFWPPANLRRL